MEVILIVWAFVAVFWLLLSTILLACSEVRSDKRKFSRGIFLAPVWPLVIIHIIWLALSALWYLTDWNVKDLKRKSSDLPSSE